MAAFTNADRVKETTTTTGTGTYSLAGAVTAFRTFVAGVGSGNRCTYCAENGTDWEINEGTVTDAAPDTLTRDRLLASSTGAAISWGAGTKNIFCVHAAADQNPRTVSLAADAAANSTTTGVEITGLALANIQPGNYVFQYSIRYQAAATATGVKFGLNFTGTGTLVANMLMQTSASAASDGTNDQATSGAAEGIVFGYSTRSETTTAPDLGPNENQDTLNADMHAWIHGNLVVTAAGELELWHASEDAAASTVKLGSSVILTRTG